MPAKKKKADAAAEETAVSQTETNSDADAAVAAEGAEAIDVKDADSQTEPDIESSALGDLGPENVIPQTDLETAENTDEAESTPEDSEEKVNPSQTDSDISQKGSPSPEDGVGILNSGVSAQTDIENSEGEDPHQDTAENKSESESGEEENAVSDENSGNTRRRRNRSERRTAVVSIDEVRTVETEADKIKNDLLDLLESQKTGRILTGTIQGVERSDEKSAHSLAVIYHGDFKILIPAEEAVEPPDDYKGNIPEDVMYQMLLKRLGAEVDYIVKGVDAEAGIAAASRLEAMRKKRRQYYFSRNRDSNNYIIRPDICAEARVVSVTRGGIFVDLFGLEVYIPLRELSYQRWLDASGHFRPGQRILVKVLEVDRKNRDNITVAASVKQAGKNPYEQALKKYSVGNRYVGTVSMVDTTGVFVALDEGIDCLCSYPKRGRPPRGARVTVRVLGINYNTNRIWGVIVHIAAAR